MGVVVSVPGQAEPWRVSSGAFALLVQEADLLNDDVEFLHQAEALNGLHLDLNDLAERIRRAALLAEAARRLRVRLLERSNRRLWESELIDYLPVPEMWLDGVVHGGRSDLGD